MEKHQFDTQHGYENPPCRQRVPLLGATYVQKHSPEHAKNAHISLEKRDLNIFGKLTHGRQNGIQGSISQKKNAACTMSCFKQKMYYIRSYVVLGRGTDR